ncbi:hypothetical protein [Spirillospora sp. NPDC048819]|uniref:hypothetical protein n=1 Tax=Spirillospora sp. NPDC048819 TaxID=3155268 RepID=UPI0033C2CBF6
MVEGEPHTQPALGSDPAVHLSERAFEGGCVRADDGDDVAIPRQYRQLTVAADLLQAPFPVKPDLLGGDLHRVQQVRLGLKLHAGRTGAVALDVDGEQQPEEEPHG